jgi:general secretion pathway protein A
VYEEFYGLQERPFDLTPNPRFLFLSPAHREALSNLEYGLSARKGITLLLGDAGLGKTTLVRAALAVHANNGGKCVYVNNPTLNRAEFVRTLAAGFELSSHAAADKAIFLRELEDKLRTRLADGQLLALVIDEAQSVPHDILEEIRLLGNMETEKTKLLPIVLAGQPELADRLNQPTLRQLKQRIALRCSLLPLNLHDTAAYIASRVRIAGGRPVDIFTREAVLAIHATSKGIPRSIGVLCDNALIAGFARGERPVNQSTLREVCRDFDIEFMPSASTDHVIGPQPTAGTAPDSSQVVVKFAKNAGAPDTHTSADAHEPGEDSSSSPHPGAAGSGRLEPIARRRFSFF